MLGILSKIKNGFSGVFWSRSSDYIYLPIFLLVLISTLVELKLRQEKSDVSKLVQKHEPYNSNKDISRTILLQRNGHIP